MLQLLSTISRKESPAEWLTQPLNLLLVSSRLGGRLHVLCSGLGTPHEVHLLLGRPAEYLRNSLSIREAP